MSTSIPPDNEYVSPDQVREYEASLEQRRLQEEAEARHEARQLERARESVARNTAIIIERDRIALEDSVPLLGAAALGVQIP